MYTIAKTIRFEAAHRLMNYEGVCAYPHGHSYKAEIMFGCGELNNLGMVVDFDWIKRIVGGWIGKHWDHCFLLNADDSALHKNLSTYTAHETRHKLHLVDPPGEEGMNPTAEVMARELFGAVKRELGALDSNATFTRDGREVKLIAVTIWETENNKATYSE